MASLRSIIAALLAFAFTSSCTSPNATKLSSRYAQVSDRELQFSMLTVGAFNELRCHGLNAEEARSVYEARFGARERAINAAMLSKYGHLGEDEGVFIPIGKRCPAYRGAIKRYEEMRAELERRLGLLSAPR
jgi:hypothetical protein